VAPLIAALRSPDDDIRWVVAPLLGQFRDKRILGPLVEALDDENQHVRAGAGESLSRMGAAGIERLLTALKSESPRVRRAAAGAMVYAYRKVLAEELLKRLTAQHWPVRAGAVLALAHRPDDAHDAADKALTDESWQVRRAAAEALILSW